MEQIALISDIHGNIEALRAVLEDIRKRGIKTVYVLGDSVNYGPNSGEALDIVRELTLPEHEKTIEIAKGISAGIVLEGNHEYKARLAKGGNRTKGNMSKGPFEALLVTCEDLFTNNPQKYLADDTRDAILMKGGTEIPPSFLEAKGESTDRLVERIRRRMPSFWRRSSMLDWLENEIRGFDSAEAAILARRKPEMPRKDPEVEAEVDKYDKAKTRAGFLDSIAGKSSGIIKGRGIHCYHSSWDRKSDDEYVLDPQQIVVFESAEGGAPAYTEARKAIGLAKRIRSKEPLMIAHGHTHVPGIYRVSEGGIEVVVIDSGSVGVQRSKQWLGMDYRTGEIIKVEDCHKKASYVVIGEEGPKVTWVDVPDYEETYRKQKILYNWERLSDEDKKPMTFMRIHARDHGEWVSEAA